MAVQFAVKCVVLVHSLHLCEVKLNSLPGEMQVNNRKVFILPLHFVIPDLDL